MNITKETIAKIINHNRKPFAIAQIWKLIERMEWEHRRTAEKLDEITRPHDARNWHERSINDTRNTV